MALNIKNHDVEILLDNIVKITGESKTEAVRRALEERQQRLSLQTMILPQHSNRLSMFLSEEIWPQIPGDLLGTRLSKAEEETILGLGNLGV
ncbi:MAG: type II toxin-antitoxin system VapB family antitoxin [Ardenticatenaceae bacterium]|nr:type II toxin-antitoxin system VapB family antitoxin [Anaerolineales bacterium]MCB8923251.1 type II toxin-antitoxin system VapB family antitoxin [Ardenticatenaceae bacterium]MCB9004804.1 type II toxin-antitoxin system VapB family antitoxin [Ardenticatenaceae bacterium]